MSTHKLDSTAFHETDNIPSSAQCGVTAPTQCGFHNGTSCDFVSHAVGSSDSTSMHPHSPSTTDSPHNLQTCSPAVLSTDNVHLPGDIYRCNAPGDTGQCRSDLTFMFDGCRALPEDLNLSERDYTAKAWQTLHQSGRIVISLTSPALLEAHPDIIEICKSELARSSELLHVPIINAYELTKHNKEWAKRDNHRTSVRVNFDGDQSNNPLRAVLKTIKQQIVRKRMLDPRCKLVNGGGWSGYEGLKKGKDCFEQSDHQDAAKRRDGFVSFIAKQLNPALHYDRALDGHHVLFINCSQWDDYLLDGNRRSIRIPALSCLLMTGDLEHHGTGNFRFERGYCKVFVYVDPPDFKRHLNKDRRDQVFLTSDVSVLVRAGKNNKSLLNKELVVDNITVMPYNCYGMKGATDEDDRFPFGCTSAKNQEEECHFTYPVCQSCLSKAGIQVTCTAQHVAARRGDSSQTNLSHSAICTVPGGYNKGDVVAYVHGEYMTSDIYKAKHLVYGGEMFDAVKMMPAKEEETHDTRYFDISNYHSWLYFLKQTTTIKDSNVQLVYEPGSYPLLCALQPINYGHELVLFNELKTHAPNFQRDFSAALLQELNEKQWEKLDAMDDETEDQASEHEIASSCSGSLKELAWFLDDSRDEREQDWENDYEEQQDWENDYEEQQDWESGDEEQQDWESGYEEQQD